MHLYSFSKYACIFCNATALVVVLKGRLDCDSRRVFYATLEATQTRRTDL